LTATAPPCLAFAGRAEHARQVTLSGLEVGASGTHFVGTVRNIYGPWTPPVSMAIALMMLCCDPLAIAVTASVSSRRYIYSLPDEF
jgi:hypothetical protein